jgi:predicted Zn-dependent protease
VKKPQDFDSRFEQATDLNRAGDYARACQVLTELVNDYPPEEYAVSAVAIAYMAGLYRRMGRPDRSLELAKRALAFKPHSWLASESLVLALLKTGEAEEAVAEALRFAATGYSAKYAPFLQALIEDLELDGEADDLYQDLVAGLREFPKYRAILPEEEQGTDGSSQAIQGDS